MINVYDTANQLASDLEEAEQITGLKAVFEKLKADKGAYELFDKVQNLQAQLQQKQYSGQEITQEEIDKMKSFTDKFAEFPVIAELMDAEKKVNDLVTELNGIITKPIADIYSQK